MAGVGIAGDGNAADVRLPTGSRLRVPAALAILLAGCAGPQSALDPAGREAREVFDLFVLMTVGAGLIWLVVMGLLIYALVRPAREHSERTASRLVWIGGIAFPVVVLTALLAYALPMMPAMRAADADLQIRVSGEQFWWRVAYERAGGDPVVTANEVWLPVGRSAEVLLDSPDVVHSFWIPSLAGKVDMIPGRTNRIMLRPERIGRYRGVCAELCGDSHAYMAFDVRVVDEESFARWLNWQAQPAVEPATLEEQRGARLFHDTGCGACHDIRGASGIAASGEKLGPDLTHVGSRATIAAGLLPNNQGTLAGWIAASQDLKPGNRMPSVAVLPGEDLRALAAYLKALR